MQQLGCEWAMVTGLDDKPEREVHTAENYLAIKERFSRFDVQVYRIAHSRVHNVPEITLNLPGRDERIDEFCRFITELGKAGIHYNTYAHMATGIWSSGTAAGRGGTTARVFDPKTASGRWNGRKFANGELVHGREYTENELWENYEYFIRRVAPVAEAAGVYIGIHPDDPPVYPLGGVPRALLGSFKGYCRALEIANSPNIGACLCLGCWLEGGKELMGADVFEAIRYFAGENPMRQNKLFKVHFRNVSNPGSDNGGIWQESLLDEGYQDMAMVMKALTDVGFDGCAIPDHIPAFEEAGAGLAYSVAYMRALVQASRSLPAMEEQMARGTFPEARL